MIFWKPTKRTLLDYLRVEIWRSKLVVRRIPPQVKHFLPWWGTKAGKHNSLAFAFSQRNQRACREKAISTSKEGNLCLLRVFLLYDGPFSTWLPLAWNICVGREWLHASNRKGVSCPSSGGRPPFPNQTRPRAHSSAEFKLQKLKKRSTRIELVLGRREEGKALAERETRKSLSLCICSVSVCASLSLLFL